MCFDTTETAVFPEPLSSPAGGQKRECEWVCLFAALCVFVFVFQTSMCLYSCVNVCIGLINLQVRGAPSV